MFCVFLLCKHTSEYKMTEIKTKLEKKLKVNDQNSEFYTNISQAIL